MAIRNLDAKPLSIDPAAYCFAHPLCSERTRLYPRGPRPWVRRVMYRRRPAALQVEEAARVKYLVVRRGFATCVALPSTQGETRRTRLLSFTLALWAWPTFHPG